MSFSDISISNSPQHYNCFTTLLSLLLVQVFTHLRLLSHCSYVVLLLSVKIPDDFKVGSVTVDVI